MQFSTASSIEQIVYQMRLSDWPRSKNRALINSLANGSPPYTSEEVERNGKAINVNDLTLTRLSHDARMQLAQAFNKPGNYFSATTDMGAASKRQERGMIVTREISKKMKQSDYYFECGRSKFAQVVLHGIGPGTWQDTDHWCPMPVEISDVLVPSNTYLTFRNLPFFAIWRGYTAHELRQATRRARRNPDRNPGWNLPVVDAAIKWADTETAKLYGGTTWSDYWVPEKMVERFKQDSGVYASDLAATIDCWDFYYWDDAKRHEGWRRRIVFDAFGGQAAWAGQNGDGYGPRGQMPDKNLLGNKGDFLFNSGDRVVADDLRQVLHCQFADLSAVAPFKYHSVRSLGFMLYAASHLMNRLNCASWEATFENLLMYIRVASLDDVQRALKLELMNRGIIDESIHFLRPDERWQPNPQLTELGLGRVQRIIDENSASYVQNQNMSRDKVEKTKFQVMAEVNAMQTLVSAGLQQAYRYQASEYREIFRRFMKADSADPEVRDFRSRCISKGVPDNLLVPAAWDIEPERILGGGNKTLEMAIAQQLMEWRAAYTPEAQQRILRKATLSITDDAAEADLLVPNAATVSDAKYNAMLAFGTLMAGGQILKFPKSQNTLETTQTLIAELGIGVELALKLGGTPSEDKVMGFSNVVVHIDKLIAELAKDKALEPMAKMMADMSGKMANEIKGFAQRAAEAKQAQGVGDGEAGNEAATTAAKVKSMQVMAEAKAANTRESHAQRTAQKQVSFEMQMQQAMEKHQLEMQKEMAKLRAEMMSKGVETAAKVHRDVADAQVQRELTKKAADEKPTETKES